MANVALAVDILARDRASATFKKVGAATQEVGEKTKAASLSLGGLGKLFAGGALLGGVASLGKLGVQTAASMEQARISFTTMLGSGQKADAFLKQLQTFAAKTPFEFPELQTAASSLISIGVNAKDVIPIMTTLGNVTSGMGTGAEGVQRATVALQQMIAAQRISGEDLNQLRDAGIPVFDLLSKATGKSTAEIAKMAQAGKLGKKELDAMLSALKSGKGLERFQGLMDKQSQSLSGLWSTFKDTLGMGLARLITPAIPALKRSLDVISRALSATFSGITRSVSALHDWFVNLAVGGQKVTLALSAFWAALREGDVTSNGLVGNFERVGDALHRFGGWITGTALPAAQKIGTFLADTFGPTVRELGDYFHEKLIPAWQGLAKRIQDNAGPLLKIAGVIGVVVAKIAGFLLPILVKLAGYLAVTLFAAIGEAIGIVGGLARVIIAVGTAMGVAAAKIVEWGGKIVGFVSGLGGRISRATSGMWDGVKNAFRAALNWIIDKWNGLEFKVPGFSIPGLGKVGGVTIGVPDIPRLAAGGIVSSPTLALIGEAGPEAVVPLSGRRGLGGDTYVFNFPNYVGTHEQLIDVVETGLRRRQRGGQTLAFQR